MKKTLYSAPECEIVRMGMCNQVLTGSDLGEPGKAGSDLDVLPGFDF